eukprot:TRINITY_DN84368_c0_g1_i1.p1 TRINITY_DN84368_c0_g1~~TRINITY_DN84368_c0_g1_i1.p1  ORF type:complete len:227 (+),score=18.59 TRINITY_DN84368_c0_g1_i1:51-731(+)
MGIIHIKFSQMGLGPQNDGTLDPIPKTAHQVLLDLDELMKKYKRFQTREDWEIELSACRSRRWALAAGIIPYWTMAALTAQDKMLEHYMHRSYSASYWIYRYAYRFPRPLQMRQGFARRCAIWVPTVFFVSALLSSIERTRVQKYLKNQTVFGEVARNLAAGNVADPFITIPKRLANKPADKYTDGDRALASIFMPGGWTPGSPVELPVRDTLFDSLQKVDLPGYC